MESKNKNRYLVIGILLTIMAHTMITETLKIVTYNIRHGENMRNIIDLDGIASVLNDSSPDLVALQEVDYKTNRTGYVDQCGHLANQTLMNHFFSAHREYDGGLYGNCVLSKSAINYNYSLPLPHIDNTSQPTTVGVVSVNVSDNNSEVLFISAHLDYRSDPSNRLLQVNLLLTSFNDTPIPVIIGGDFNSIPTSREIIQMKDVFVDETENIGNTYPSDKPDRKEDYVFLSKKFRNDFKLIESKVIPNSVASDHRPVFVELLNIF